jgi:hypothetical protein
VYIKISTPEKQKAQLAQIRLLPQTKRAQSLAGRRLKETHRGIFGLTPEQKLENSRKGGSIGGLKAGAIAVSSGRLASYRTPENQKKGGRKSIELHGSPNDGSEASREACRLGGRNQSREHKARAGSISCHNSWHVVGRWSTRGVPKWYPPKPQPDCTFCIEQKLV